MMNPTVGKAASESRTVRASLLALLLVVWAPLVLAVGALAGVLGLDLDAAGWTTYGDDGVIDAAERWAIVRDTVVAVLAWLSIRYRIGARAVITSLLRRT